VRLTGCRPFAIACPNGKARLQVAHTTVKAGQRMGFTLACASPPLLPAIGVAGGELARDGRINADDGAQWLKISRSAHF
jgi:hypothetical protein